MSGNNETSDIGHLEPASNSVHVPENMTDREAWAHYGLSVAMNIAHETATNAGWYVDLNTGQPMTRNFGEVIALMTSELSEALESDRKSLMDDKLPHRSGIEVELADFFIRVADTSVARGDDLPSAVIEVGRLLRAFSLTELRFALALLQTFALAAERGLDLAGAVVEKNRYNRHRSDHQLANRMSGGKRY